MPLLQAAIQNGSTNGMKMGEEFISKKEEHTN